MGGEFRVSVMVRVRVRVRVKVRVMANVGEWGMEWRERRGVEELG